MKAKILLSILSQIIFIACSIEDPDSDTKARDEKLKEEIPKNEPDTEPPSAPVGLKIFESSFESLTLTWNSSSDNDKVAHYQVFLDDSKLSEENSTHYTFTGLDPGSIYFLSVLAVDVSGNTSAKSETLEAKTPEDTEDPSIPKDLSITPISETSIMVKWTPSTDTAGIKEYDIFLNDEYLATTPEVEFSLENLTEGTSYFLAVLARDIYGNISSLSEPLEIRIETTQEPPTPPAGLLFFSEYIEGSSHNKALEIANSTGTVVDLRSYSIKKISNENTEWSDEKFLEGTLADADVFVLAHTKAIPTIIEESDLLMGGGVIDFNGNDTVGLFKDGELVDIIGNPGGQDFAKDVTLRRRASAEIPNLNYDPEDWDIFESDTVDGLGKL